MPETVSAIPAEFLPFAQNLVSYLGRYMNQPHPNVYQQALLSGFFGGGGRQPDMWAQPVPMPTFTPTPMGAQPGTDHRDILGQDITGRAASGWERPLFGPAGTDPVFGGSRINTALMSYLDRIFPGYSQRASAGMPRERTPMAGPWEVIGGREAPWGGGTVGGLMDLRAESAAREMRVNALLDELARQISGQ